MLCEEYPGTQQSECKKHADAICKCIGKAYDEIMGLGGPRLCRTGDIFGVYEFMGLVGPVCTQCAFTVETYCDFDCQSNGLTANKYFYIERQTAWGGPGRPLDYTGITDGHSWDVIRFRGTRKPLTNNSPVVATVDIWNNPSKWWNQGKDSCGHECNFPR